MDQNWISYSYAMHWMRTCLRENRGKSILKQACRIQGTGFLFASELVKDGWRYTSLTEDRSFCTDAVIQNYRISYCDEAVFYDEQPYRLKVALRQRLRWSKGHLQSTVENCPKLLKNMFSRKKNFAITYDSFWLNFPHVVERTIRKLLTLSLELSLAILSGSIFGWRKGILFACLSATASDLFFKLIFQALVFFIYKKRIQKSHNLARRFVHACAFPLFDIFGKWTTLFALFKRVEWRPIPHDQTRDVKKLQ